MVRFRCAGHAAAAWRVRVLQAALFSRVRRHHRFDVEDHGATVGGQHRLQLQRQGVQFRATSHGPRVGRCRVGGRRRRAVQHHRARVQQPRCDGERTVSALRRGPTGHERRRRRSVSAAATRGQGARVPPRRRGDVGRLSHVLTRTGRQRRARRDDTGSGASGLGPECDRIHQRAWDRDPVQRRGRIQSHHRAIRRSRSRRLHEGLHGPHARRVRGGRGHLQPSPRWSRDGSPLRSVRIPSIRTSPYMSPKTVIETDLRYALSNAFAFGGNNCSLLLERGEP